MSQPPTNDADLLRFMEQAESYPHRPEKVRHLQTHISHVFIADPYVYKIKKPVDFDFLDYSTLDKRAYYCRREVELNSRLCSHAYLGVTEISSKENSFVLGESPGSSKIVEYAVKMKLLPQKYFLHTYLERNLLKHDHLERLAQKLSDFYLKQEPDEAILQWGSIENIKYNTDENFRQTAPFVGESIGENTYRAIEAFTNGFLTQNEALFLRRIREKRIIDGHGDLHLEHIHMPPEGVCIYDCIEFNERFRFGDWSADLAFLAMDLDFHDRWELSRHFINRMSETLSDPDLAVINEFYKCYRAYVKGKVKSLQSREEEVPQPERDRAAEKAALYFSLSLRYALIGSGPTALIVMGNVGSGKTTIASHLSQRLNVRHFASDLIRKSMAGLPLDARTPETRRSEIYSPGFSRKTYQEMEGQALKQLKMGKSCILDATYSSPASRERLIKSLNSLNVQYLFIEAYAREKILKNRLRNREKSTDIVSDARLEDFQELNQRYRPPEEIDAEHLIRTETDRPPEHTIKYIYDALVQNNLNSMG